MCHDVDDVVGDPIDFFFFFKILQFINNAVQCISTLTRDASYCVQYCTSSTYIQYIWCVTHGKLEITWPKRMNESSAPKRNTSRSHPRFFLSDLARHVLVLPVELHGLAVVELHLKLPSHMAQMPQIPGDSCNVDCLG